MCVFVYSWDNVNWVCVTDIQTCLQQKVEREGKLLEALWCGHRPHVDYRVLIFSRSTDDKFPVTGQSHGFPRLSLASSFLDIHLQISLGLRRDPKQSQVGDKLHDWIGWGGERAHSRTQLSHLVNGKGPQHKLEGNHPVIWRCADVITDQNNFKVCLTIVTICQHSAVIPSERAIVRSQNHFTFTSKMIFCLYSRMVSLEFLIVCNFF